MKNRFLKITTFLLLFFLCSFFTPNSYAQTDAKALLENLEQEELKNLDALAMYPEDTRLVILEATLHPEAIIKIQRVQEKTKAAFTDLMSQYPQATQKEVWDLTRYPNLIHRLLIEGNSNQLSIDNILLDYPTVIHERAKKCLKNNYDVLKKIDAFNQTYETAFKGILENYNEQTQHAFRELIALPEVMTVLNENIEVTILVGDAYRNYPKWVLQKADSLHLKLAKQNVQELEDWKKRVKENPELTNDLQASAEDFTKEYGYDDLYYDAEDYDYLVDDLYHNADLKEMVVIEKHYYYNYPYWFGYPTWYAYPRWRPYPYWHDWGFNYRPGYSIDIFQMPSFYFVDWYFYRPQHHYNYPHLSAHFVQHYYGHRHSVGGISTSVATWRTRNQAVISEDMVVNAPRRVEAYKEFGKMETARMKYNTEHPKQQLSQKRYVERSKTAYPKMKYEMDRNQEFTTKGKEQDLFKKDKVLPRSRFPEQKENPKIRIKKQPRATFPKSKTQKENPSKTLKKKQTATKKANEYHEKTWEQSKRRPIISPEKTKVISTENQPSKKSKPRTKTTNKRKKTKNN